MAQDTIDKIVRIQFDNSDLGKKLQETYTAIDELNFNIKSSKKEIKDLEKAVKDGNITREKADELIREERKNIKEASEERKIYNSRLSAYSKELQNNIKMQTAAEGSLTKLRAEVSKMTTAYNNMSKSERESAAGKEFAESIKAKQEEINKAEMALGNYRSQVGNYENAIKKALPFGNNFITQIASASKNAGGFTNMLKNAGTAMGNLTKQAMAFIATPIGIVLGLLAASYKWVEFQIKEVNERINKNSELYYENQRAMSGADAWQQAYANSVDRTAKLFIQANAELKKFWTQTKILFTLLGKKGFVEGSLEFLRVWGEANELEQENIKLADDIRKYDDLHRENIKEIARIDREIEAERLAMMDRVNLSEEERNKHAQRGIALTKEKYSRLREEYELEKRILETKKDQGGSTKEELDKLAQLEATLESGLYAQQDSAIRTFQRTLNYTTAAMTRADEQAERNAQQARQRDIKAMQTLKALQEQFRAQSEESELQALDDRYSIEREKLRAELAKEKNLSEEAKRLLNGALLQLDENYEIEKRRIADKWNKKDFDNKVRKKQLEIEQELLQIDPNDRPSYMKGQLEAAKGELEIAKSQFEELNSLAEEAWRNRYESQEDYANAVAEGYNSILKAQNKVIQADRAIADFANKTEQQQLATTASMVGGISDLFGTLGSEIEEFAVASKLLAIAEVIINAQKATMEAMTATEVFGPIVGPILFAKRKAVIEIQAAASIASIVAQMIPKFAQGGLVTGPGTGTSDSIPAMLSNGESVMTARATADWGAVLSAINVESGGHAINVSNLPQRGDGMRGMRDMMESVMMSIPTPVVLVKDINAGQRRVKVAENLGKLGGKKKK